MHFHKSFWHLESDFSILPSLHLLEAIVGEITRKATLATYWKMRVTDGIKNTILLKIYKDSKQQKKRKRYKNTL